MNSVLFSSNSDEWATPQEVFDSLNDEFCFTLDAAATEDNHKCDRYYTMAQDGLNQGVSSKTHSEFKQISTGQ